MLRVAVEFALLRPPCICALRSRWKARKIGHVKVVDVVKRSRFADCPRGTSGRFSPLVEAIATRRTVGIVYFGKRLFFLTIRTVI